MRGGDESGRPRAASSGLRPHPDVVAKRLDDEVVLVNLETNLIYTLNSTAARFWELLESGEDRAGIAKGLESDFEIDAVAADEEIEGLLKDLAARGLVEIDAGG